MAHLVRLGIEAKVEESGAGAFGDRLRESLMAPFSSCVQNVWWWVRVTRRV